jgi:hypothetical protein
MTSSLPVCERLNDLLRSPSPGRMLSHIEMQHLATIVSRTINTNSTLMVIVGTVKKSIDIIWPTWLCRKVRHVWLGRWSLRRMRDTLRSEIAMRAS